MKKTAIIVMIMAIVLMSACTTNQQKNISKEPAKKYEVNFPKITKEISSEKDAIAIYQEEVLRRQEEENFMSKEEISFFQENGYNVFNKIYGIISLYHADYNEIENFYFPILFENEKKEIYFFYTESDGDLRFSNLEKDLKTTWCGNVHTSSSNIIAKNEKWAITYDKDSGKVQRWSFGKVRSTNIIPAGSVYAGVSEFEGYIFRSNTDIYSIKDAGVYWVEETLGVQVIAHNVAKVIATDYCLAGTPNCQPLFLMTDGSVKAYVGWEGDQKPDSETHLVDIYYEGGFRE